MEICSSLICNNSAQHPTFTSHLHPDTAGTKDICFKVERNRKTTITWYFFLCVSSFFYQLVLQNPLLLSCLFPKLVIPLSKNILSLYNLLLLLGSLDWLSFSPLPQLQHYSCISMPKPHNSGLIIPLWEMSLTFAHLFNTFLLKGQANGNSQG